MECKHEDGYTRSHYEGDKLKGAAGYCRDCETGWVLDIQKNEWVYHRYDGDKKIEVKRVKNE